MSTSLDIYTSIGLSPLILCIIKINKLCQLSNLIPTILPDWAFLRSRPICFSLNNLTLPSNFTRDKVNDADKKIATFEIATPSHNYPPPPSNSHTSNSMLAQLVRGIQLDRELVQTHGFITKLPLIGHTTPTVINYGGTFLNKSHRTFLNIPKKIRNEPVYYRKL